MPTVGQIERETQQRVVKLFHDTLPSTCAKGAMPRSEDACCQLGIERGLKHKSRR